MRKAKAPLSQGSRIFMVIAMSALALDIGLVHIQSSREQTAADAAALAGCTLFPFPSRMPMRKQRSRHG